MLDYLQIVSNISTVNLVIIATKTTVEIISSDKFSS